MSCGAETEANAVMTTLLTGVDFSVPEVDLSGPEFQLPEVGDIGGPITKLTNADLTDGTVGGAGTFDVVMKGIQAHLTQEYDKGRITGEQYAKAHVELTQVSLANSVQFLLGRDQAYWGAVRAQLEAQAAQAQVITARVQLETAKVQLQAVRIEAKKNEAEYALTKMKLATESVAYCVAKYNLDFLMPAQLVALGDAHAQSVYQLDNILPAQKKQVEEQAEATRAQTLDTRFDGATVVGVLGKQKDLYTQQITSYKRDAEVKTAKLFTDAWITMKSIDEGLLPPGNFNNTSLDAILADLKTNNDLGA